MFLFSIFELCKCFNVHYVGSGASRWVLQSREDGESKEGTSTLSRHHYRRWERLPQPLACLHHQCAAGGLPAQRRHRQNRSFSL